MLDIDQGIQEIGNINAVKVVEWRGECKELLFLIKKTAKNDKINLKNTEIEAVSIDDDGNVVKSLEFTRLEEKSCDISYASPQRYIYEPGPAFQKSGAFQTIAIHYGVQKLHAHTHLYTSDILCGGFPGKVFEVQEVLPVHHKSVKGMKTNLAVRNFPEKPDALMKRLKIKPGGDLMMFACTLMNDEKALILCRLIDKV